MDANGSHYHLILGYENWADCLVDSARLRDIWRASPFGPDAGGLHFNLARQELTLNPQELFEFGATPGEARLSPANRRGASLDIYGNWYWLGADERSIMVRSAGSGSTGRLWPQENRPLATPNLATFHDETAPVPEEPQQLRGLVITASHYLVVGTTNPGGLLVFDLHAGTLPRRIRWPVAFTPFDMAPAPHGGIWVLDRIQKRYWGLDARMRVMQLSPQVGELTSQEPQIFYSTIGDKDGAIPARHFPAGVSLNMSSPVSAAHPVAIEALPNGDVLILDQPPDARFATIYHYRGAALIGELETQNILDLVQSQNRAGFSLKGHDLAYLPQRQDPILGPLGEQVLLVTNEGNQAFSFNLLWDGDRLEIQPTAHYWPLRLFGGKGLVASGDQTYYDYADRWLPLMAQRRPRYTLFAELTTPGAEQVDSPGMPPLDGAEPDLVWHRLMLDACIPPHSTVQVWSRAANSLDRLQQAPWEAEPAPYLRRTGSELPFVPRRTAEGDGTWELLLQRANGRYLQIKLRLTGNGQNTPRLRALRVYYPRFSYLEHYLPAVYREDADAASFLDRYLANLEGFLTTIEDRIAAAQILFDVRTAPAEALAWLASWYGLALYPGWDESRRRLFIRHAMEFFQWRGTIRGLQLALQLMFDPCPDETIFTEPAARSRRSGIRIIETFRTRTMPPPVIGDPTAPSTGLRQVPDSGRWQPTYGGVELQRRYVAFLEDTAGCGDSPPFDLQPPDDAQQAACWRAFSQKELGFVPAAGADDLPLWTDYLTRRYRTVAALNEAYGLAVAQFAAVPLPTSLPPDGAPLSDWYQFESILLPMHQLAHNFTVLLPVGNATLTGQTIQQEQRSLVRQLIELEKPAHTIFDIKFYFNMFRLGEVRLGDDSVVDLGSHAPQLLLPIEVGETFLSESVLTAQHPQNVTDRQIFARDRLKEETLP